VTSPSATSTGDGKLDVALAALGGRAAKVRLGLGDGTSGLARGFGHARDDATGVTAAEFNDDCKLDLIVVREVGSVGVLLGNGDGTFGVQTNYRMARPSGDGGDGAALVGDFNGDGIADIADSGSGALGDPADVRLGAGDGSFGPRRTLSPLSAYTSRVLEFQNRSTEAVGDFNRDGPTAAWTSPSPPSTMSWGRILTLRGGSRCC